MMMTSGGEALAGKPHRKSGITTLSGLAGAGGGGLPWGKVIGRWGATHVVLNVV